MEAKTRPNFPPRFELQPDLLTAHLQEAARAVSPDEREAWLRIAEGWLALLRKRRKTSEEGFDAGCDDNKHGS